MKTACYLPSSIETKFVAGFEDLRLDDQKPLPESPQLKSAVGKECSPTMSQSPVLHPSQRVARSSLGTSPAVNRRPTLKLQMIPSETSLPEIDCVSPFKQTHPIPDLDSGITELDHRRVRQDYGMAQRPFYRPLPRSPSSPLSPQSSSAGSRWVIQRSATTTPTSAHSRISPASSLSERDFQSWVSDSMGVLFSPKDKKYAQKDIHARAKDDERSIKWSYMRKIEDAQLDSFNIMPAVRFAHDSKFEARIWKGIPQSWRLRAWLDMSVSFSGFYAALSKDQVKWLNSELFKKYRDLQVADSPFEPLIANAVETTLPRLAMFQGIQGIYQKESLSRILTAISLYNCEIGFIPGINLWVGLLLTLFGEESTFFIAQRLFYDGPVVGSSSFYNIKRLYSKSVSFMTENVLIHDCLLQLWLLKVKARLDKFNISSISYLEIWYHSLFVACSNVSRNSEEGKSSYKGLLPWPVVLRVWDLFMFYGWDVLCLVSVAILDFYSTEIMDMDPTTLSYFLGIEAETQSPIALGIPVESLPSISNPDKFIDVVHQLLFNGRRRRFGVSTSGGRLSVDSAASMNDSGSNLTRLSGRDLVKVLRRRFHRD